MTKRDLFRIIIKLFGLYSLILSVFTILPRSISYIINYFDIISLLWVLMVILLIGAAFILLIRKTDIIINWLKLDKGFDDDAIVLGDLSASKIIMLGSIIIGGFLLIDNIPAFLNHSMNFFKESTANDMDPDKNFYWLVSFLNLFIGYFMITNYGWIAKKLIKEDNKSESTE